MERLASVSVDLDSLPHYCRIYDLPASVLSEAGHTLVHRVAVPRFLELCHELSVPLTLFAIGDDLAHESCASALRSAHAAGAEIANHSHAHDYALTRRPVDQIRSDVERGEAAIAAVVGHKPVGFRAPGYTLNAALYGVLAERGYRYDSSTYPAAPYWAAKAAVLGAMRVMGKKSGTVLDSPRVLLAPADPYRPDPADPYRRGEGSVLELPIATAAVTRFPFIGTYAAMFPSPLTRALYLQTRGRDFFNFELHGIDLLDESDGVPKELLAVQRDARVPVATKLQRLRSVLSWLKEDYRLVTLRDAAERLGERG